jgi:hypothetical protein
VGPYPRATETSSGVPLTRGLAVATISPDRQVRQRVRNLGELWVLPEWLRLSWPRVMTTNIRPWCAVGYRRSPEGGVRVAAARVTRPNCRRATLDPVRDGRHFYADLKDVLHPFYPACSEEEFGSVGSQVLPQR